MHLGWSLSHNHHWEEEESKVGIGDVEEGVGMEHAYGMGASFVE